MDTSPIFNKISSEYDRFNHLFSMNIDKKWRKSCAKEAYTFAKQISDSGDIPLSDVKVLDLACGTADLSIMLAKKGLSVVGADISEGMLEVGRKKIDKLWQANLSKYPKPELIKADAASLPFGDSSIDAVTVGYGIRNFNNREQSLKEIMRVLKPNGLLLILEFGEPRNAFVRVFYKPYFKYLLPRMASVLTAGKDYGAYKYFIDSVEKFPKFEKFCKELALSGFCHPAYTNQTGGISVLYRASKPIGK